MTIRDEKGDTIEPIAARHDAVINSLTEAARADQRVIAAWLQGSRADGSADAFSDIDYYVAIEDEAFNSFDKLEFVSQVAQVLVHAELFGQYGVACLLEGPVKLDFFVERASTAQHLPRPAVNLLMEKTRVMLKTGWEPSRQDVAKQVDYRTPDAGAARRPRVSPKRDDPRASPDQRTTHGSRFAGSRGAGGAGRPVTGGQPKGALADRRCNGTGGTNCLRCL
jgi:predicted nucleotidyltransferase